MKINILQFLHYNLFRFDYNKNYNILKNFEKTLSFCNLFNVKNFSMELFSLFKNFIIFYLCFRIQIYILRKCSGKKIIFCQKIKYFVVILVKFSNFLKFSLNFFIINFFENHKKKNKRFL